MASNQCRKRGRIEDPDCDDCMPISKRINRLQIRPSLEASWNGGEEQDGDVALNNNLQIGPSRCCQQHNSPEWNQANGTWQNSYNLNHWQPGEGTSQNFNPQNGRDDETLAPGEMPSQHNGHPAQNSLPLGFAPQNGFCDVNGQISPSINSPHGPLMGQNEQQVLLDLSQYEPELKPDENPNYYQANRLLFEAHKDRINRIMGCKTPP